MIKDLPFYIPLFFIITTLITFFYFIAAIKKGNPGKTTISISIAICAWLMLIALLAYNGFFLKTDNIPPRFMLAVAPGLLTIIILFVTKSGRKFIDSLPSNILTQLHSVRILVEITLFLLFTYNLVPKLMTFEGRNFDILAGLTAPFIAYYGYSKIKLSNSFIMAWNIFSLLLLLNIVINAVLSAPFPFQQFAFEQPNVAVLYFPFAWLPAFIVPVVFFSHLAVIRKLTKISKSPNPIN